MISAETGCFHSGDYTAFLRRFLIEDVAPVYREATLRLVRINTDGGPEFGRAFSHYRTAFRYRYDVSAADIDATSKPGSATATSSGRTAATAPPGAPRPRSSTRIDRAC